MTPTIALADDFFTAFAALPKKAQKAVREFTRKFRENPKSPGLHYEPIQAARDPRLKSVRVTQEYRAIVLAPDIGDVFVLLWVDHHDEAYRWAQDKQVVVHPKTGSLQLLSTETSTVVDEGPQPTRSAPPAIAGRFRDYSDDQLFSAGIPRALLPAVRAVYSDDELENLLPHLPAEAAEVLTGIAAGMTLDEAIEEVLAQPAVAVGKVDTEDVAAALERPQSGRKFKVVDADFDLEAALDAPLETWRVFLHPSQRALVEASSKGPVRVLGAAGTGKTVVAMHRAAWLVRKAIASAERVLVTTFTVNLASDIATSLATITSPDEMARIEVVGVDALATRILRDDLGQQVRLATSADLQRAWREAVDADASGSWEIGFYQAEWQDVVQAQGIRELEGYLSARRAGRGVKVQRSERRLIWPVFEAFQSHLSERGIVEREEILRRARIAAEEGKTQRHYAAIVVDETQDMSVEALKLLRALAGTEHANDMFLVGDAHQRIYGHAVALSTCGINVRGRRSRHLRINYRTTDRIRKFAMRVLENQSFDDLDEGTDTATGYVSLRPGLEPELRHLQTLHDEQRFLTDEVKRLVASGIAYANICITARTRELLVDYYEPALAAEGIEVEILGRESPTTPNLRMATMHRVKGLEFPVVFIAGVQEEFVPLPTDELKSDDLIVARYAEKRERCLLYVASSRARDRLFVSGHGARSSFLPQA